MPKIISDLTCAIIKPDKIVKSDRKVFGQRKLFFSIFSKRFCFVFFKMASLFEAYFLYAMISVVP